MILYIVSPCILPGSNTRIRDLKNIYCDEKLKKNTFIHQKFTYYQSFLQNV